MMRIDDEYFDAINRAPKLAAATKTNYIQKLRYLKKFTDMKSIDRIINNPTKVNEKLLTIENKKTRLSYMSAVIAVFKHACLTETMKAPYGKWETYYRPLWNDITRERETNKPTKRQEKTRISWDEVLKMKDSFSPGETEHVFLSLYVQLMRRQRDFYDIRIYRDIQDGAPDIPNTEGYVYIPSDKNSIRVARINIVKSKNFKPGEFLNVELSDEVRESIEKSIANSPRSHLFMANLPERGKKVVNALTTYKSETSFRQWSNGVLSRLFKPAVTITSLRHAKATWIKSHINWSVARRNQEANLMGHSRIQSELYHYIDEENDDMIKDIIDEDTNGEIQMSTNDTKSTKLNVAYIIDESGNLKKVECLIMETLDVNDEDRRGLLSVLK
jgi:hypothetical protein